MRRIIISIIFVLLLMTGCGKNNESVPHIESHTWSMFSVQSAEDGQAIAYGEYGSSTLDTAKKIELICVANDGSLTITDKTNGKSYFGTYKFSESSSQSVIYEVVVDGKEGMAVTSMTTYQNGDEKPTFIISLETCSINFYAEVLE